MFRLGLVMFALTAVAIYFKKQVVFILHGTKTIIVYVIVEASKVFPFIHNIRNITTVIVLFFLPILIALIPAYLYWAIKRAPLPQIRAMIFAFWVITLMIYTLA